MQKISRFENCVQKFCQTVASYDAKITNIEQIVSSLAARVTTLETMQCPSPVALARQDPGTFLDMVAALQPMGPSGPMAKGRLMTLEIRRVDLILSQAPKMNMHGAPSYNGSHVNNTPLGLRIESITFGKSQIYQPITNPLEFIAKQVPCQPGSYSKQEPSIKTLWPDIEMMVSPMKLTVLSATPKQVSRSANPSHLETGKSENNLRLCGKCWQNSSKFSSLKVMAQVPLLSLHSTPVHKFSASRIEETAFCSCCT